VVAGLEELLPICARAKSGHVTVLILSQSYVNASAIAKQQDQGSQWQCEDLARKGHQ